MRVTHRMIAGSVNINLQRSLERLDQRSRRLSTGKTFLTPSEDPAGTQRVMRYRDALNRNERCRQNIDEAKGWLRATETALMEALAVMQRTRDLCVYGANGTLTEPELASIAAEIKELGDDLVGVGNTAFNGLYIFGGHRTVEAPYQAGDQGIEYVGDQGQRRLQISPHQEITVNLPGQGLFLATEGTGLIQTVSEVQQALVSSEGERLGGPVLGQVEQGIELLLERLAEVGARFNRLSETEQGLLEEELYLREMVSQVQDLDFAKAITEYSMEQYAYQAALATASRVLQPNLLNYLG